MWQYWVGHGPTYARAFWIAARSRTTKPAYRVTLKTRVSGFYGHLLWVQFLFLFVSAAVIVHAIFAMPEASALARLSNIAVLLLLMTLMSGICQASFYGVSKQEVIHGLGDTIRMIGHRVTDVLSAPLRRRGWLPRSVVEHDD
jgi:hypothetical protein